jgi:hypothetical protein
VSSDQCVLKNAEYTSQCDTHDQVSHYKACWVVKDYKQQFDIDYDQTFVSVIKLQTYKTLLLLQHIMTLKWIKWTLLLCSFMTLSIRLFTLSYLTAMSYLTRLLCWIRPSMAWSKHLVCDIRLYTIFSHLLISVDLILIIACSYKTVSSSLSMLTTFCLLKE